MFILEILEDVWKENCSALTPGYSRDTQEASGTRGDEYPAAISLAIVGYQRTVNGAGGIYSRHFDKM